MPSKKFTVLFVTMNMPGHLNGCIGLAERLYKLNCRIVFVTIGKISKDFAKNSTAHNFEMLSIEEKSTIVDPETKEIVLKNDETKKLIMAMVDKLSSGDILENYAFVMKAIHKKSADEARQFNEEYEKVIKKVKPDLLIIDQFFSAPSLTSSGIPWAIFMSANPLTILKSKIQQVKPLAFIGYEFKTKEERQKLPNWLLASIEKWVSDRKKFNELFPKTESEWNKYAEEIGGNIIDPDTIIVSSPYFNIYMYPKALDYDQDDDLFEFPPNWLNSETTLTPESGLVDSESNVEWLKKIEKLRALPGNEHKPLVYFSLGSLASSHVGTMKRFVELLSDDSKRLYIFSKGSNGDMYELNESNMIGANFVPQLFILTQVDLAIIHGGNNSLTECMYFGKPCVLMPIFGDQPDNAQRVEDLKVGHRLNPFDCTKEELFGAVEDILSNANHRVKKIGEEMRQRDEAQKVAQYIVNYLENQN